MATKADNLLKKYLSSCKRVFHYLLFISLIANILMLTVPIYMLQIYDRVLNSFSYETLIFLTLIAIVALFIFFLLDIIRARIIVKLGAWLDENISPHVLYQSIEQWLRGNNYGATALRDVTTIRQFLSTPSTFALFDVPWMPIYIIVIFLLHPALGLISVFGVIILFAVAFFNERKTRTSLAKANSTAMANQNKIDISIRNAEVITGMGMTHNLIKRWHNVHQETLAKQTGASQQASVYYTASKTLRLILQIMMLGVGAFLVINGSLTAGGMIAGAILLARALAPVEQSIGVWKQFLASRQAYKRLTLLFGQSIQRNLGIELPKPKGAIAVEKLIFGLPNQKEPILKFIDLKIPVGGSLAILGPSGSGKTTLARLIIGALKPSRGVVRMDGADVYQWDRKSFGNYVGYLPQDIELFPAKINENIARLKDYKDKDVIAAAKLAGVHDMILQFQEGYDTDLSQSQFVLSGGQRQRIALARALYGNPCLVVLDEPNSNLDNDGERALINVLRELKARKTTTIIITHKMNLIKEVDNVLILKNGEVQIYDSIAKIASLQQKNLQNNG